MTLWALDIAETPEQAELHGVPVNYPWQAHRIVGDSEGIRITACGLVMTQGSHPRGWHELDDGKLPMAGKGIHCG